jgi:hypothetical protein
MIGVNLERGSRGRAATEIDPSIENIDDRQGWWLYCVFVASAASAPTKNKTKGQGQARILTGAGRHRAPEQLAETEPWTSSSTIGLTSQCPCACVCACTVCCWAQSQSHLSTAFTLSSVQNQTGAGVPGFACVDRSIPVKQAPPPPRPPS